MTSRHMDLWSDVDARLYTLQRRISNTLQELLLARDTERLENNALVMFQQQRLIDSLENSGLVVSVFIDGLSCFVLDDSAMEDIRNGFCDTNLHHWPSILLKICEILENRYDFQSSYIVDHQHGKTVVHQLADIAFEILQHVSQDDNLHMLQFITGSNEVDCLCVWSQLNPEMDLIETLRSIVNDSQWKEILPFCSYKKKNRVDRVDWLVV